VQSNIKTSNGYQYPVAYENRVVLGTSVTQLTDGTIVKGTSYEQATVFHNIRYGQSTEGKMRFQDPVAYQQPAMVDATKFERIMCPQLCYPPYCEGTVTEDCLLLSVHVPSGFTVGSNQQNLLPVMVWIHGGAYILGSSTDKMFDNTTELSNSTNTIIVSINYRLGFLGFLPHEKAGIGGNQGIKDQRLAMKWVNDNIAAFGGDKDKITIFGESAGAVSVMFHLLSEESGRYYNRAIVQSNPENLFQDLKSWNAVTDTVVRHFRLLSKCSVFQSSLDCLQSVRFEDIVALTLDPVDNVTSSFFGARTTYAPSGRETEFLLLNLVASPIIDGIEFKDHPLNLFKSGRWNTDKDVIIGNTNGEVAVFGAHQGDVSEELAKEWMSIMFGGELGPVAVDTYKHFNLYDDDDYKTMLGDIYTQFQYTCYTRAIARSMSETSSAAVYLFEFAQPINVTKEGTDGQLVLPKALHGHDLTYLFGVPYGVEGYELNSEDKIVMDMMKQYWSSFAKDGVPTSTRFTNWPAYKRDNSVWSNLVIKASNSEVSRNSYEEICNFWDQSDIYTGSK